MMRRTLAACAAVALALSGCAHPPSPKPVPLAEYQPPASPFKDLTVAVILSENTKKLVAYGLRREEANKSRGGMQYSMETVVGQIVDVFKRDFKHAIRAENLRDGVAAGADVVAVFDFRKPPMGWLDKNIVWMAVPPFAFLTAPYLIAANPRRWTTDYGLVFLDPAGRTVDTVRVVSTYYSRGVRNAENAAKNFNDALLQAQYELEKGIVESDGLRAWSERRKAGLSAPADAPARARADFDLPDYKRPLDEDRFAVVVGVERYEHAGAAAYAEADAVAVKAHLLAMGYPQRNIVFLSGERAGRAGIEKTVEAWLPERVSEKSKVLFYFAGHGSPDAEAGDGYLLPHDGDPKFLSNTGYPLARLYQKLDELKAAQVVAMIDAGFSGTGGRSVLPKGVRPLVASKAPPASKKLVVLEAAGESETAGVDPETGHGLLTAQVLKTLKERKGDVKLGPLYDEAAKRVADLARRENRDQRPRLSAGRGLRL